MKPWLRWTALSCLLLAFILVPFALWDESVRAWAARLLTPAAGRGAVMVLVVLLLAGDIALPVPSSFVSAGAVSLLGAPAGALCVAFGMTIGAWLAYGLGRWGGEPLALRVAGPHELERARSMMRRHGHWVLLACRGVPVVAEASTLLAGATRVNPWRFAVATGLGNLGIASAYASIGLLHLSGPAALVAPFALGVLIPGLALLLLRPLASA